MAQQRNRKSVGVLLALGAPIAVAVLGVSVGLTAGTARADNGQPIILGTGCPGSGIGTNCETIQTRVVNTGGGFGFEGVRRSH
jgi:hypothetical protein